MAIIIIKMHFIFSDTPLIGQFIKFPTIAF